MSWLRLIVGVLLVVVLNGVGFSVGGIVSPPPMPPGTPPIDEVAAGQALGVVALGNALVLALLIRQSAVGRWRLLGPIFLLYWGTSTLMTQVEVAFFTPSTVPEGAPLAIVIMGTIQSLITVPAAVWLLGPREPEGGVTPLERPVLRLALAALLYPPIYLAFGYYVAMASPELLAYYDMSHPGSFGAQLAHIAADSPVLFAFQLVRGFLWAGMVWLTVSVLKGPWWRRGLLVGLGLGTFMAIQLWMPNPLMPWPVAWAHLLETFPSNALYGLLATGILLGFDRDGSAG